MGRLYRPRRYQRVRRSCHNQDAAPSADLLTTSNRGEGQYPSPPAGPEIKAGTQVPAFLFARHPGQTRLQLHYVARIDLSRCFDSLVFGRPRKRIGEVFGSGIEQES